MTNLPGEGQASQPPLGRDAIIEQLQQDMAATAGIIGQLALRLEDMQAQLVLLKNGLTTVKNPADPGIVELYDRAEDAALAPQEKFDDVSEANLSFQEKLEDIFMPSMNTFTSEVLARADTDDDKRINGHWISSRVAKKFPTYVSDEPKEWDREVSNSGRRHEWRADDLDGAFTCSYHVDYLAAKEKDKDTEFEMVGYGFNARWPQQDNKPVVKGKPQHSVGVHITCAQGKVRRVETTSLAIDGHDSVKTVYDFEAQTITKTALTSCSRSAEYTYNPDQARFENKYAGASSPLLRPEDVFSTLREFMAVMPVKKSE